MKETGPAYDLCEVARRSVPQFATGAWQYVACSPLDSREHSKNSVGSYSISYRGPDALETSELIVAKLYKKRETRSRTTYEGMQRLWDAGLRSPSPYRIARPLGYSLNPPVLFMEKAAGEPWREAVFRGGEESLSSSRRAAGWLLRLHETDVPSLHRANRRVVTARVQRLASDLSRLFRGQSPRLYSLAHTIVQDLLLPGAFRPSHGDFHARNLFLAPDFATGIDFDNLAAREAAFDVGYAMGYLLVTSWAVTDAYDTGARAADAFLEQYLSRGHLSVGRVRLHIGRSILQHVHFGFMMHNPRFTEIERWLDLIERFVEGSGRMPILETPARSL